MTMREPTIYGLLDKVHRNKVFEQPAAEPVGCKECFRLHLVLVGPLFSMLVPARLPCLMGLIAILATRGRVGLLRWPQPQVATTNTAYSAHGRHVLEGRLTNPCIHVGGI